MIATEVNDIVEEYQIGSVLNFVFGLFFVFLSSQQKVYLALTFINSKKPNCFFCKLLDSIRNKPTI